MTNRARASHCSFLHFFACFPVDLIVTGFAHSFSFFFNSFAYLFLCEFNSAESAHLCIYSNCLTTVRANDTCKFHFFINFILCFFFQIRNNFHSCFVLCILNCFILFYLFSDAAYSMAHVLRSQAFVTSFFPARCTDPPRIFCKPSQFTTILCQTMPCCW